MAFFWRVLIALAASALILAWSRGSHVAATSRSALPASIALMFVGAALLAPLVFRSRNLGMLDEDGYVIVVFEGLVVAWASAAFGLIIAHASSQLPARRPARVDPRCISCGYNLTGNVSGRCPECGTDVQDLSADGR